MKTLKTESGEILVVGVPKDAYEFRFSLKKEGHLIYRQGKLRADFIQLDKNYEIIGKLSELTDEDCEEFVENDGDSLGAWYKNYANKIDNKPPYSLETPKKSFLSLLQFEGIDTSKEWLVIKIIR